MDITVQKIREILAKNDKIGIAVGKNPGIDEMGAALALYLSLSNSGKSLSIACPTEPIVEISSLVGIDKVKTSFDSNASGLIVSFPDRGDIKKISYTREDGMLNIVVKAGDEGLSFSQRDIKFRKEQALSLLFTVGAPRVSDLGKVFDEEMKGTTIINIDNKAENQGYGDIVLISKKFSSVSEQVASLIFALDLNMDQDAAQNLLLGILASSDNFQNPNTTPLAFEMMANLMKKGATRPSKNGQRADVAEDLSSFFAPQKPKEEKRKVPLRSEASETLREEDKKDESPPDDWLAPKIYKGSTTI